MTFIAFVTVAVAAFLLGRLIEHRSWTTAIDELAEQHNADLATGTPIGSQLAREMGITL